MPQMKPPRSASAKQPISCASGHGVVTPGRRVVAVQLSAGNIDPVNQLLPLVPADAFAQRGAGVQRQRVAVAAG